MGDIKIAKQFQSFLDFDLKFVELLICFIKMCTFIEFKLRLHSYLHWNKRHNIYLTAMHVKHVKM